MALYEVKIKETEIYLIKVEADSEDEAKELAFDELDNAENKNNYHYDSESEAFVTDIY